MSFGEIKIVLHNVHEMSRLQIIVNAYTRVLASRSVVILLLANSLCVSMQIEKTPTSCRRLVCEIKLACTWVIFRLNGLVLHYFSCDSMKPPTHVNLG